MRQFVSQYKEISIDNVKQYLTNFDNVYSYNNAVKALKHLGRIYGIELPVKVKPVHSENLIIAPKKDMVLELLERIRDKQVKTYLSLCATTGIRVTRLLNLNWSDIDLDNDMDDESFRVDAAGPFCLVHVEIAAGTLEGGEELRFKNNNIVVDGAAFLTNAAATTDLIITVDLDKELLSNITEYQPICAQDTIDIGLEDIFDNIDDDDTVVMNAVIQIAGGLADPVISVTDLT